MTGRVRALVLAVVFLAGASVSGVAAVLAGGEGGRSVSALELAEQVADDLAAGRHDRVHELVRPDARSALSVVALRDGWERLVRQVGDHRSRDEARAGDGPAVVVPIRFARAVVDLEVTFDAEVRIAGLYLRDRFVPGSGEAAAAGDAGVAEAEAIADALATGSWSRAAQRFSPTMAAAVPQVKLELVWRDALAAGGPFLRRGIPEVFERPPDRVVVVPLRFTSRVFELRVSVAPDGQVIGLFLTPSTRPGS